MFSKILVTNTLKHSLNLLDNTVFRSPNIHFFTANHFRSFQDDLLGCIELCQIHFLGIASRVRCYFFMNVFGKLEVLVDRNLHLHSDFICGIWEQSDNLDCVLGRNHVTHFRSTQASLVSLAQLPEPISHLLVEVKCLPVVSTKESKSNYVLGLSVRPAYHWPELALLILNHLFAPLSLRDCGVSHCFKRLLPGRVLSVCNLNEGF